MESVNNNNPMNASTGSQDNILSQDGLSDINLEAYTVVLSAAAHVLSSFFGGGSSIAVIIAITSRSNINKYSYAPVLMLFMACCSLNFIWSPLEVVDLVVFHLTCKHLFGSYLAIKTYIYMFLLILISFIITLLSVEGVIRMKNCFGKLLRKIWPLASSVFAFLCSAFLTAAFVIKTMQSMDTIKFSYVVFHNDTRSLILMLTVFAFGIVSVFLFIMFTLIVIDSVFCENGQPHLKQKKLKLAIPEFLISQSNACADNDGGFEHSQSGTPSPSTPKLLSVGNAETASNKGDDAGPIPELPSPVIKPVGNRLGINMAQVLGRRRHTICQISDSSGVASTSADTASKAKQYNYVRKFSVDISALQAQLQNPKICKEAPFQSDIDLSKKQTSDKFQSPKPLLPVKPLPGKFSETEERLSDKEANVVTESGGVGTSIPSPPVIMVSNDDAPGNTDEGEIPNDVHGYNGTFHEQGKGNTYVGNAVQKPTSLTLKETAEENFSEPNAESAVSDQSDAESDVRKMARLTLLLCLTFVLNMLPVVVTEVMESKLSKHAFINISTCTLAVSSIQTIVYPHLITCCDDVIHRAVQKLKKRCKIACSCRSDHDVNSHAEDSSSTSQV